MNTIAQVIPIVQLILSILLIVAILVQRASDGIEGAFGGGSGNITYFARRGGERFLFIGTIVLAVLFALSAVIAILV